MVKVIITKKLEEDINKIFKKESLKIFAMMKDLEENPYKGKAVGHVGGIVVKELKYGVYRFYFVTDGFKIKMLKKDELNDLLIRFVRMSDKKNQQKIIDEIKDILRKFDQEAL